MSDGQKQLVEALLREEDLVAFTALSAYSIVFQEWCESMRRLDITDFEKVRELEKLAARPLQASLSAVDRRLLFGTLRDIPLRWIAKVTGSDESPETIQLVRSATKSVLSYASPDLLIASESPRGTTAIVLEHSEVQALVRQLPFIIGGLLGGSIASMESRNASQLIAMGAKLDEQVQPYPSMQAMVRDRLIVKDVPKIRLIIGQELEADLRSILRRRGSHGTSSIAGLQVKFDTERDLEIQRWWCLGIPTVRGHWPALHDLWLPERETGLLRTSYVIQPVGLNPITRDMKIFESRFPELLNVTYDEVEWFTEGLFRLVALHSGIYAVSASVEIQEHHARGNVDSQRLLDPPEMFLRDAHDVWNRGAIRNSRTWFIETLHGVLDGDYPRESIERLIGAFTAEGDLRNWLQPFVFYEMTAEMLVLDLFEFADIHERILRMVSSTILGQGDIRGNLFEERCTSRILDEIGLVLGDRRVIRSFPMKFRGRNYGDVDLAIVCGDILVNIDMKSHQKDFKYFYGGPEVVKYRQEKLARSLEDKVTDRGEKLASLLSDPHEARSRGLSPAKIGRVFSFLCVAGPEFISRAHPALWYGNIPRVATPSELAILIMGPALLAASTA